MNQNFYEIAQKIFEQAVVFLEDEKRDWLRCAILYKPAKTKRLFEALREETDASADFLLKLVEEQDSDEYHFAELGTAILSLNGYCKTICEDKGLDPNLISLMTVFDDEQLLNSLKKALEPEVVCKSKKIFPAKKEPERIFISTYKGVLQRKLLGGFLIYKTPAGTFGLFKIINDDPFGDPFGVNVKYMFMVKDGFRRLEDAEDYSFQFITNLFNTIRK